MEFNFWAALQTLTSFLRQPTTTLKSIWGSGRTILLCGVLLSFSSVGFGQTKTEAPATTSEQSLVPPAATASGLRLTTNVTAIWDFGLQFESSAGAIGVNAIVPVPRNWPEQTVERVLEFKSDNVQDFSYKQPTKWTEQISFSVPRMSAGQQEYGYVRYRIKKRMIEAPQDTTQFVIAKKPPSKLKTFLKPSPFIESRHKRIRKIAKELFDDSLNGWEQVKKNYDWVRENVTYKFDPTIRSCLEALDKKEGDCEELSSLFIAICRCQGVPARAVWIPGHTYPEFYLEDKAGQGHWFPCQAAGTYQFGSMAEIRPILQKGDRFKMPGEKKEVRYLRPTLQAREATGPLAIKDWIRRDVTDRIKKSDQ